MSTQAGPLLLRMTPLSHRSQVHFLFSSVELLQAHSHMPVDLAKIAACHDRFRLLSSVVDKLPFGAQDSDPSRRMNASLTQ